MKDFTAVMARKNTDKNYKNVQCLFTKRLKEISKAGNSSATFNPEEYGYHLDKIIDWLESLNFICKQETEDCIRIIW